MKEEKSVEAKYKIIAADIEAQIKRGELKPGDAMNSELKTQQQYDVSRVTVRKAYKLLLDKGIIRTVHGVGTFVNDLYKKDWTWMNSFTTQVLHSGHVPTTKTRKFSVVEAGDEVASRLGIKMQEECYYMERVRYIDNQPIWITRSYIPVRSAPDLTASHLSVAGITQSLFKVLDINFNIKCTKELKVEERFEMDVKDAKTLNGEPETPLIVKSSIAFDDFDIPVVYQQAKMLKREVEENEDGDQMKVAVHMSMFCKTWVDDIKPSLEKVNGLGFNGVEISLFGSTDEAVINSCNYAKELGMDVICGTGVSAETDPSSSDPVVRENAKAYLMKCIDKVEAGGGIFLNGVLYAPWQGFSNEPREERWKNASEVLTMVGLYAKEKNIGMNIEVINRFETDFFNRIDEAVEFLQDVKADNVKLLVDTFHMNIEEDDMYESLEKYLPYIGCIHICENHRGVPGTGHIDWKRIVKILEKYQYNGYLDMETFVESNTEVGDALFIWNGRNRTAYEEAKNGINYIRSVINETEDDN
ncbi:MAG: TIM barrel protein [Eubacteriales bacterium]